MDRPRFRVNAKQTAKGHWYMDVSVELFDIAWPPDAEVKDRKTAVQLWTDHARALRESIKSEMGGTMADEAGDGK